MIGHRGDRPLDPLHVILAFGALAEVHVAHPSRHRLLGARDELLGVHQVAQQLGIGDDREIDVAPRGERKTGEARQSLVLDRGPLGVQIADGGVCGAKGRAQRFESLLPAPAFEVVPEGLEFADPAL